MHIEQLEEFALSEDREAALSRLVPGTEDHYFLSCLHHQHRGELGRVESLLMKWTERYGETARVTSIRNRQVLLRHAEAPKETNRALQKKMGLRFDHQREARGQRTEHPTSVDPAALDARVFHEEALRRHRLVEGFSPAAHDWLLQQPLEADRRRALLSQLDRPDRPGLVSQVLADLREKTSGGFGSLPIHGLLTTAQLTELQRLHPPIATHPAYVDARLVQLQPRPDDDWQHEPVVRRAYLERLWAYVANLPPAFNSLKVTVLHARLAHDRAEGVYDRGRFLMYLSLPRQVSYASRTHLQAHRGHVARLNQDHRRATLLVAVRDDQRLVRDYLLTLLRNEGTEAYLPYLREDYVTRLFAEAQILAGRGDAERHVSALGGPTAYEALRERVEIELTPNNPRSHRVDDPVELEVDLKNVPSLVVRVFEINALSYFQVHGREVDTSVDLDGLVASEEQLHTIEAPADRRVRRRFAFESLRRAGAFVIELIGNGKSSRALIQKGVLRYVERIGAAGHVMTVLDDNSTPLPDARVWIGGQVRDAREDGTVLIPFSTQPGRTKVLLQHGALTTLEDFEHRAEAYRFEAGLYVAREQLLSRGDAEVIVRPVLRVAGVPVSPELLEDLTLEITTTDRRGTASSTQTSLTLRAGREATHTFRVPADLQQLSLTVRARVRSVTEQRDIELTESTSRTLNQVDREDVLLWAHLRPGTAGYALHVIGKGGEPRADVPVTFDFWHLHTQVPVRLVCQTDENGVVSLGPLEGLSALDAFPTGGRSVRFPLHVDAARSDASVHAAVGETIRIPHAGSDVVHGAASLLERVGDGYRADHGGRVEIRDGYVCITGLPAGDHALRLEGDRRRIEIRVAEGAVVGGWLCSRCRLLETRSTTPPTVSQIEVQSDSVRVRVLHATPRTRVHVVATRFVPEWSLMSALDRGRRPSPETVSVGRPVSHYVSGREIGDEARYVLERRQLPARPGSLLARPSLLLNPWATRSTSTNLSEAAAGGAYGSSQDRARRRSNARADGAKEAHGGAASMANLDFLRGASPVLCNLSPDEGGLVTVPREALGDAGLVRILLLDGDHALTRLVPLDAPALRCRDLSLSEVLDPEAHFVERRQTTVVAADGQLALADITTAQLRTFGTVGDAHALLSTLSGDDALREMAFVTRWPSLPAAEQRELYAKHACHELHLFLYFKDRGFFDAVVHPYLRNKLQKTFLDRYLLGDDLSRFRTPWAFAQLNALERCLLMDRIPEERELGRRGLEQEHDLTPPDVERDAHLFRAALGGGALEGDRLGMAAARERASKPKKKRAMGGRGGGGPPPIPQAPPASSAGPPPGGILMSVSAPAPAAPAAEAAVDGLGGYGGDFDDDVADREEVRRSFRAVDRTKEWAENQYHRRRISEQGATLIRVNAFWRAFARHVAAGRPGPFVTGAFVRAAGSFAEPMCALAVLDLPFEADAPDVDYQGSAMTLATRSVRVAFHQEIQPAEPAAGRLPILVSQHYVRPDDRYRWEGSERVEKYVLGELLTHVTYVCQVVLTNPTASSHELDLLLQIPEGAVPVADGFVTRGTRVRLEAHGAQSIEYAFYFPATGQYSHFPVHVARNELLIAHAEPATLTVVAEPSEVDSTSWAHVSQHGAEDEVLRYLAEENLGRVELPKVAWRMRERAFYERALAVLERRHVWDPTVWAYSVFHDDSARIGAFLQLEGRFLANCGAALACPLVTRDPVARREVEHLEYAPLINARAHRLGGELEILNQAFAEQYRRFLDVLAHLPETTDADRLSAATYLLLMDRVEAARAQLARVDPASIEARLQLDYLRAYLALLEGDPATARALAEAHATHPVDRWQTRFRAVLAVLDEAEGASGRVLDPDDREQAHTRLAGTEPGFELEVEGTTVRVSYQNLARCDVRYYPMDLELLFSREPFLRDAADRFSIIEPARRDAVDLPTDSNEVRFELPEEYRSANTIVEVAAGSERKSRASYANDLRVQLTPRYGQVRVASRSGARPLPATYVKVYARRRNGDVAFYKDGYTDVRGLFDYASLSTDELDHVERFAILVQTEAHGAVVREAAPPQR
ncbi:MAG: hypothetical protein AB8I08_02480 [Sandaracinaceae bacterium]